MTLIDTAEMYGEGGAEEVVGEAIAGQPRPRLHRQQGLSPERDRAGMPTACERSLKRLRVDRIDLYLLHWRGSTPIEQTVEAFERLRSRGKIRHWGVSNFDAATWRRSRQLPDARATDQVLYTPAPRHRIRPDALVHASGIPVMAYSPVGQGGRLLQTRRCAKSPPANAATPAQIAIAWTLRDPIVTIPKASDPKHVRENATAAATTLTEEDLAVIDATHPPPRGRQSLDIS